MLADGLKETRRRQGEEKGEEEMEEAVGHQKYEK